MGFIEPKNLAWKADPSRDQLDGLFDTQHNFLALIDPQAPPPGPAFWIREHCAFLTSSWPTWMLAYNWFNWQDRVQWWVLYSCGGH